MVNQESDKDSCLQRRSESKDFASNQQRVSIPNGRRESTNFWISAYGMLFFLAASNSSPGTQPASVGSHAARVPSTKANLAMTASPVKSMSGLYLSLGW